MTYKAKCSCGWFDVWAVMRNAQDSAEAHRKFAGPGHEVSMEGADQ